MSAMSKSFSFIGYDPLETGRRRWRSEKKRQRYRVRERDKKRERVIKKTGSNHCSAFPWRRVSGVGVGVLRLASRKVAFWNECEFPQGR